MKNRILLVIYLGIIAVTLMIIGVWNLVEEFKLVWLLVTGLGVHAMMEANKIFSKLQFGEIEVEGED